MRAIQVARTGGPEVLTLVDVPVPDPKPNEALVQINVAGVNFVDVYFREGRYPPSCLSSTGRRPQALWLQLDQM